MYSEAHINRFEGAPREAAVRMESTGSGPSNAGGTPAVAEAALSSELPPTSEEPTQEEEKHSSTAVFPFQSVATGREASSPLGCALLSMSSFSASSLFSDDETHQKRLLASSRSSPPPPRSNFAPNESVGDAGGQSQHQEQEQEQEEQEKEDEEEDEDVEYEKDFEDEEEENEGDEIDQNSLAQAWRWTPMMRRILDGQHGANCTGIGATTYGTKSPRTPGSIGSSAASSRRKTPSSDGSRRAREKILSVVTPGSSSRGRCRVGPRKTTPRSSSAPAPGRASADAYTDELDSFEVSASSGSAEGDEGDGGSPGPTAKVEIFVQQKTKLQRPNNQALEEQGNSPKPDNEGDDVEGGAAGDAGMGPIVKAKGLVGRSRKILQGETDDPPFPLHIGYVFYIHQPGGLAAPNCESIVT